MIQKFRSFTYSAIALLTFAVPLLVPVAVAADNCAGIATQVAAGATASTTGGSVTCGTPSDTSTSVQNIAKEVVNIFSIIVGAASVFMIIYGGFRYITSGGDSSRVGNAKNTLIYAIIGLIVVALAQVIVTFVISKATSSVNGTA